MKRLLILPVLAALLFNSCQEDVWRDHENPQIYFPQQRVEDVIFTTAWMYDTEEYTIPFGVYLSGVRPENQNSDINVGFAVNEALVDEYNADEANFYEGRMELLPANCYSIEGNSMTIPRGEINGSIPVRVFTEEVADLPLLNAGGDTIVYVIPLVLTSTSDYNLHSETERRIAFASVVLDTPRFYFWANRDGPVNVSRRVTDVNDPVIEEFLISAYGVHHDDDYVLTFAVDADLVPPGGELLPPEAYDLPTLTVTMESGQTTANFPVSIINDQIPEYAVSYTSSPWNEPVFYFLPIVIESASRYGPDEEKSVLMLRVSVRNDYEFNYQSEISRTNLVTGLTYANSFLRQPSSLGPNTLRLSHVSTWGTGAGTFLNVGWPHLTGFYALTVVPTDDPRRWGVTAEAITNEGAQSTYSGFDFNEDDSYYDWSLESFFLFYRVNNAQGSQQWEIVEILEAQL